MAGANTKTPVMILQEYTVKRNLPTPEYSIIQELTKQGTHQNEFHYQVVAVNLSTTGRGTSKQIAKHEAAKRLLDTLAERGLLEPSENPAENFIPGRNINDAPGDNRVNGISSLNEICEQNKLHLPEFHEISAVGPPHLREFTFECHVGSIHRRATARTKKQAKQLAARLVIDAITLILPELRLEYQVINDVKALTDKDEEIIRKFADISVVCNVKIDKTIRIEDYPLVFKRIVEKKNLCLNDIVKLLEKRDVENFNMALDLMDVTYMIRKIQETPIFIVTLSCNTDSPFCMLGQGCSYQNAIDDAVQRAINGILQLLK